MNDAIKTQISAFVDGELPGNESELLLRRLSQDIELRQQAAEYFAIGRALRGHRGVPGIDKLREQIAAALDDKALQEDLEAIEPVNRRFLRPVAGVAIAATVALAAIFSLQQVENAGTVDVAPIAENVDGAGDSPSYTVPDAHRGLHNMEAGDLDALRATFERRAEEVADLGSSDEADDDVVDDDANAEVEADTDASQDGQTP